MSFEETFLKFEEEASELQKREMILKEEVKLHWEKYHGFLREQGLPENHTHPGFGRFIAEKIKADKRLIIA